MTKNKELEKRIDALYKDLLKNVDEVNYLHNEKMAEQYKAYIENGRSPLPLLIFMYAEANFWLKNFDEAEKSFEIVIEKFPQLNENKRAMDRIRHIKRSRR